jgi:hypothetical protein
VTEADVLRLEPWAGPWEPDDPNANYKAEVALYSKVDPLATLRGLSEGTGIPVGAIARYVLARYATLGSGGLLELGPVMVEQLWSVVDSAEADGSDAARLRAFASIRGMLAWLRLPLHDEAGY